MEMHQLRYVAAVARTGNFSRAAEQCHVSQPSLSQQILKLEEELGQRLFDRHKRLAKLTPHGQAFLPRALRILAEVEQAQREAGDASQMVRGTFTLGVLPTIAPYLLPRVLVAFAEKYPGIETVIHEDTTQQLLRQSLAYELDLIIISHPVADPRLTIQELFTEELQLALPPRHPLLQKRRVVVADLLKEPLIVMKPGHCLGDQVLGFCEQMHFKPRISFRGTQLETIQALVHTGAGISLIPAMAVQPGRPNAPEYRSLPAPTPHRIIIAVWPRQRPPSRPAAEFLKVLQEHCPKLNTPKS